MLKKRSVLYTWGLSYILLLLVMVVMCFVVGQNAQSVLIDEYKSITQTLQQRASAELSSYFTGLESSAYEISNDYVINDFLYSGDPYGPEYYNLLPIQKKLDVYVVQTGNIMGRYLYMDNIKRTLSRGTIFKFDELYLRLGLSGAITPEEFQSLLTDYHYNDLLLLDTEREPLVFMLTSVPLVGRTPKGTLIQQIDPHVISELMQANTAIKNSTTALLDGDRRLLCSYGDEAVAKLLREADLDAAGSEIVLDGENYWIRQEPLTKAGWTLVTVVPMATIRHNAREIIRQTVPAMLMMITLAALLCLLFVYIQWRSLRPIRQALRGEDDHAASGNEYERILRVLTNARTSRDQIQTMWESQANEMRQEFMWSCLSGEILYNEERLRQMLGLLDIGFDGDWFGVVLLESDAEAEERSADSGSTVVKTLLSCLPAEPLHRIYQFPYGQQWVLLLNADSGEKVQEILGILQENLLGFAQKYAGAFQYAVSSPRQDFINIHLAWLEATEIWNQFGDAGIGTEPAPMPRLTIAQEELLCRYIAAGNTEGAMNTLQPIIQDNLEDELLSLPLCRCLTYDLLWGVMRSLSELPEVWEAQKESLRTDLHRLRHATSHTELAQLLKNAVERSAAACSSARGAATQSREQPIDRIMACVEEHYRESDFNVSRAAELLGFSVPYLSNLFKRQTGIGMLSYINGLRVQYARQCILQRRITVAQAAREAGFENINTFIRLFKKYEGTTPGSINEM